MRQINLKFVLLSIIFCIMILTLSSCSSKKYETNTHDITEEFNNIAIKTDTADVNIVLSESGECKVVCYEESKKSHSVVVQNSTLTVNVINDKKWYDYIGFNFDSPKITVYLPKSEYSSLIIEESTGDIEISKEFQFKDIDISLSTGDVKCYASALGDIKIAASTGSVCVESKLASSLDITVSTGKVTVSNMMCDGNISIAVSTGKTYLTNIVCKNLSSTGSTGDISLRSVISSEKIIIERSTGDVMLDGSDAAELFITTDTGDVEGSLLTEKVFIVRTDTGDIHVPNSITGGRCEITTDTGDIKISILFN